MNKMYVIEVFGQGRRLYSTYEKAKQEYNRLVDEFCKAWPNTNRSHEELIEDCSNWVSGEANYLDSWVDESLDYGMYLYDIDAIEEEEKKDKMYVVEIFGKSRNVYSTYEKAEEVYNNLVDEHCKEWPDIYMM